MCTPLLTLVTPKKVPLPTVKVLYTFSVRLLAAERPILSEMAAPAAAAAGVA